MAVKSIHQSSRGKMSTVQLKIFTVAIAFHFFPVKAPEGGPVFCRFSSLGYFSREEQKNSTHNQYFQNRKAKKVIT